MIGKLCSARNVYLSAVLCCPVMSVCVPGRTLVAVCRDSGATRHDALRCSMSNLLLVSHQLPAPHTAERQQQPCTSTLQSTTLADVTACCQSRARIIGARNGQLRRCVVLGYIVLVIKGVLSMERLLHSDYAKCCMPIHSHRVARANVPTLPTIAPGCLCSCC